MNVTAARSIVTACPCRRSRASISTRSGAVAMSSSPCKTSVRSPRRSETSVSFQPLVPPYELVKWTLAHPALVTPQDEPHGGPAVGLDAPAVGEAADEVEPEAAGLVQRAEARLGREALAAVADLDADLGVPARVELHRLAVAAVPHGVGDDLGDEQPQRLDLAVGQVRRARLAEPGARRG